MRRPTNPHVQEQQVLKEKLQQLIDEMPTPPAGTPPPDATQRSLAETQQLALDKMFSSLLSGQKIDYHGLPAAITPAEVETYARLAKKARQAEGINAVLQGIEVLRQSIVKKVPEYTQTIQGQTQIIAALTHESTEQKKRGDALQSRLDEYSKAPQPGSLAEQAMEENERLQAENKRLQQEQNQLPARVEQLIDAAREEERGKHQAELSRIRAARSLDAMAEAHLPSGSGPAHLARTAAGLQVQPDMDDTGSLKVLDKGVVETADALRTRAEAAEALNTQHQNYARRLTAFAEGREEPTTDGMPQDYHPIIHALILSREREEQPPSPSDGEESPLTELQERIADAERLFEESEAENGTLRERLAEAESNKDLAEGRAELARNKAGELKPLADLAQAYAQGKQPKTRPTDPRAAALYDFVNELFEQEAAAQRRVNQLTAAIRTWYSDAADGEKPITDFIEGLGEPAQAVREQLALIERKHRIFAGILDGTLHEKDVSPEYRPLAAAVSRAKEYDDLHAQLQQARLERSRIDGENADLSREVERLEHLVELLRKPEERYAPIEAKPAREHVREGIDYMKQNDYESAREPFERALAAAQINLGTTKAALQGLAYSSAETDKPAARAYARVLTLLTGLVRGLEAQEHSVLARIYTFIGEEADLRLARTHSEKAHALNPTLRTEQRPQSGSQ